MFDIRQKPDAPCIIQKTTDGVDWTDTVNMQLCPPKLRKNGGVLQWFDDNTGTWEPVDTGDERVDGDAPIPYPDNPDGACLAAENITAVYQSALTEIRSGITAGRDLVAIAAGISGIMTAFMPLSIVTTIAFGLTATALAVGVVGLDDMLDAESLDNFKCSIFCEIEPDGSITASDYTALRDRMAVWAELVELEIINVWLDAFGSVGLQRMALAGGITTGDCVDCECDPPVESDWIIPTGSETPVSTIAGGGGAEDGLEWASELISADTYEICLYANATDEEHVGYGLRIYARWMADGVSGHVQWDFRTGSQTFINAHEPSSTWAAAPATFTNSLPMTGEEILVYETTGLDGSNYDAIEFRLRSYSIFNVTRIEWYTPEA